MRDGTDDLLDEALASAETAQVHREIVSYAVRGARSSWTVGAVRNRIALAARGTLYVTADDDVGPAGFAASSGARVAPTLDCRGVPFRYTFGPMAPADPGYPEVTQLCGTLGTLPSTTRFVNPSPLVARRIQRGEARVAMVVTGSSGDSGSRDSSWRLLQPAALLQGAGASDYDDALRSPVVTREVEAPRLTSDSWFMSMAAAFDGRALLPPFPPDFRNGDHTHGVVRSALCPENLVLHLPGGLLHRPLHDRAVGPWGRVGLGANEVISHLTRAFVQTRTTLSDPWQRLGAFLIAAASDASTLSHTLREPWTAGWLATLRHAEELLQRPRVSTDAVRAWRSDLRMWCASIRSALDAGPPQVGDADTDTVLGHVRDYGRLLQVWPTLVALPSEAPGPGRAADRAVRR